MLKVTMSREVLQCQKNQKSTSSTLSLPPALTLDWILLASFHTTGHPSNCWTGAFWFYWIAAQLYSISTTWVSFQFASSCFTNIWKWNANIGEQVEIRAGGRCIYMMYAFLTLILKCSAKSFKGGFVKTTAQICHLTCPQCPQCCMAYFI